MAQITIRRQQTTAQYYTEKLGDGVELDMMFIPGGEFFMGTPREEIARLSQEYDANYFDRESPQHKVQISPFFMGKYLITQAQWRAIALDNSLKVQLDFPRSILFQKTL